MRLLGALRHNWSGAPIFSIKTNVAWCRHNRGVTTTCKGGAIPRAPSHCGGAKSLRGHRMGAGGTEKSQQCHKYFLQYSIFASERPVSNMGAPNLLLAPGAI